VFAERPLYQGWTAMFDNSDIRAIRRGLRKRGPEPASVVPMLTGLMSIITLMIKRRNSA